MNNTVGSVRTRTKRACSTAICSVASCIATRSAARRGAGEEGAEAQKSIVAMTHRGAGASTSRRALGLSCAGRPGGRRQPVAGRGSQKALATSRGYQLNAGARAFSARVNGLLMRLRTTCAARGARRTAPRPRRAAGPSRSGRACGDASRSRSWLSRSEPSVPTRRGAGRPRLQLVRHGVIVDEVLRLQATHRHRGDGGRLGGRPGAIDACPGLRWGGVPIHRPCPGLSATFSRRTRSSRAAPRIERRDMFFYPGPLSPKSAFCEAKLP